MVGISMAVCHVDRKPPWGVMVTGRYLGVVRFRESLFRSRGMTEMVGEPGEAVAERIEATLLFELCSDWAMGVKPGRSLLDWDTM